MKKTQSYRPPYSRTRASGGYTTTSCRFQHNNPGQYPDGDATWGTNGVKGWYKRTTDVVTPGYSALRKKLQWINNPLNIYLLNKPDADMVCVTSSSPWADGYTPPVTAPTVLTFTGDAMGLLLGPLVSANAVTRETDFESGNPDVVNVNYARQKAIITCLNRIAPPTSQSLVSLAELPKTVELIAGRARKIADIVVAVMRKDVRKLKQLCGEPPKRYEKYPKAVVLWDNHLGAPIVNKSGKTRRKWAHTPLNKAKLDRLSESAKLWLEYRYGWSPLVYDLVDQMKAFDAATRRQGKVEASNSPMTADGRAVFKAKALEKLSGTLSSNFTTSVLGGGRGTQAWRRDITQKVEVHAYAHYCHSVSGFSSKLNDFGAFDVPRAIWELCPWSFIVDWFIPIGDWLGAITPKVGVEILASGVVVHDVKSVTRVVTGWTPAATGPGTWPSTYLPIGSSDTAERTLLNRAVGLALPSHPIVEVKLNLKRLVDAVSLFKRLR